jgi:hypothetical protein
MAICASPQLFAAYHVLLRLLVPRHSPYALSSLTFKHFGLRLLLFFLGFLSGVSISSYPFGHFTFAYYFINICFAYIIQFSRYNLLQWWAQMESNHRPHAYQACALTV